MNDLRMAAEKECGEELEFLCVRMPDAVYGFELACIREIIWNSRITPVPCVPEYYEGLCNWKGTIIPAASLNRMTGEEESAAGDQPVIVIAEARLSGDTPERIGEILKIKAAYAGDQEVVYVIDTEETLKCMVVFD